ncbi:MAG: twin-arginine translocation signal domain-containing protein, partial [Olsenella profusa]
RRKFIKVSGVTVGSLAAAALAGCDVSPGLPWQRRGTPATTVP